MERALSSLDAQSLSDDQFEVIFVDDDSTDDTFERLTAVCRTRPHFQVERIANSGWPGRPRNIGIARARGEYLPLHGPRRRDLSRGAAKDV